MDDTTTGRRERARAPGGADRAISVAILSAGLLLAAAVFAAMYPWFNDPFNDRRFGRALWLRHAGDGGADNPRGQMYEDLRGRLLRGQPGGAPRASRRDVRALLGPPDGGHAGPGDLSYLLGS